MLTIIAVCEVGFWICLIAGLAARYLLKANRLSVVLLLATPALDAVLLIVTALSLQRGEAPEVGHALAAIYLGFSVAYGRRMIGWADARFAYHFVNGPAPTRLSGRPHTRQCWRDVGRTAFAAILTCAITAALVVIAGPASDTEPLNANYRWMGIVVAIELITAISYTIWPRKPKKDQTSGTNVGAAT